MVWLMLEINDPSEFKVKKGRLESARIPYYPVRITKPRNAEGLAFPQESLDEVLRILELRHIVYDLRDTNISGIAFISITGAVPQYSHGEGEHENADTYGGMSGSYGNICKKIISQIKHPVEEKDVDNSIVVDIPETPDDIYESASKNVIRHRKENFEAWSEIEPVLDTFAGLINLKVHVFNPHGKMYRLSNKLNLSSDGFNIIFFASTAQSSSVKLESIFRMNLVGGQGDSAVPSFIGTPIPDADGIIAGEFIDNNLYILFDLPHVRGNSADEILIKIFEKYFEITGKTTELSKFKTLTHKYANKASRDAFAAGCAELIKLNISETSEALHNAEREVDSLQSDFINKVRLHDSLVQKHKLLTGGEKETTDFALKQFDELSNIPLVADVKVKGRTVYIYTDTIIIKYKDTDYKMGKYRIEINTSGSGAGLRIFGIDGYTANGLSGGYCHPHITDGGHCCLGNISESVAKLIGSNQYVVLAQIMMQYLQSYNEGSAYTKIDRWKNKVS